MSNTQHIILICIDTLRADCIDAAPRSGAYKKKHKNAISVKTPELDKLIKSSVYYDNCVSAAPYTSASHGAYFTGIWPLHNGLYEFFNRRLQKPTVFQLAKKQGYRSIFQTDFPVILGPYLGINQGVDSFYIESESDAFQELTKNKNNKTISFFHFGGIHYPYGFHILKFGGNDYVKKVLKLEKKYNLEKYHHIKLDDVLDETFRSREDLTLLLRYKFIVQKLYHEKKYDDLFNMYLEGINYFMKNRFDDFLKKIRGFADSNNAILILFSDHGEEWDAESEGHHNSTDDSVLRVPLMIYKKGIKSRIEDELIRTIDVAPTIINELPNKKIPKEIEGKKLNYSSPLSKTQNKYAISQVWMSIATKREISNYQKAAVKLKKRIKPLKTYLYGQIIRDNQLKIVTHYNQKGVILKSQTKTNISSPSLKKDKIARLNKLIKQYNSLKLKTKKISTLESRLCTELNSLGYRV
jgi:hypothetical protein